MTDRILFVDDEPDLELLIRQKYRREIRKGKLNLDFATSGRQALEILGEKGPFSLVMTDINMPEMSGLQLLQEIKRRDRDLTVVIISAYGDMQNIRSAMNRGAFDFLTKPIDFEDLEVTRQKALDYVMQLREKARLAEEKKQLEENNVFIRDVFGRYLSDAIAEVLLESKDGLKLGGERRSVSMLMSDLRGFSILAERYTAEQIIATLNHYFSVMIDIIMEYGGIVDEIQGDAILAIFGAPLQQDDSVLRCAACAAAMQQAMHAVNEHNVAKGLPSLSMGIGVHTGEVVLGNIGSYKRAKYGVVGSDVNLTARIQSQAIGGQVMVSEDTLKVCESCLEVGAAVEFRAKGFEKAVKIFDLRGIHGAFELSLPEHSLALQALAAEVTVELMSASGGEDAVWRTGSIVELSKAGAEIRAPHLLKAGDLTILKFLIEDPVAPGVIYAKAVDTRADDRLRVWFVALPDDAEEFLRQLLASHATGSDADA